MNFKLIIRKFVNLIEKKIQKKKKKIQKKKKFKKKKIKNFNIWAIFGNGRLSSLRIREIINHNSIRQCLL